MKKQQNFKIKAIKYYQDLKGNCPVQQYLDSLDNRESAKMFSMIDYLFENGINATRPYVDTLRDGIHELRTKITGKQIRTLYFFCYRNYIVLTHCFPKTTDKVPDEQIKLAIKYRDEFLQRFDTEEKLKNFE